MAALGKGSPRKDGAAGGPMCTGPGNPEARALHTQSATPLPLGVCPNSFRCKFVLILSDAPWTWSEPQDIRLSHH